MIGSKKLKVWVYNNPVGQFEQMRNGSYKFSYLKGVHSREEVSLLMPVNKGPFLFKTFPAVFGQHIPQGLSRAAIEMAFKHIPGIVELSEIDLLTITGRNQYGRVSFTDIDCKQRIEPTQIVIDKTKVENCTESEGLFNTYIQEPRNIGEYSGISGLMPKMFGKTNYSVPSNQELSAPTRASKNIVYDDTILKSKNIMIPSLPVNQKTCLDIAHHAGFTVPKHTISKDGGLLLLKRFDRQDGHMLGFEDFSSFASYKGAPLPAAQYAGTYADAIKAGVWAYKRRGCKNEDIQKFEKDLFERISLSNILRDNNLHLKNIGLLYSKESVALSPVYDVTCTEVLDVCGSFNMESLMSIPWETRNGDRAWKNPEQLIDFGNRCTSLDQHVITESVTNIVGAIRTWCEQTIQSSSNDIERAIAYAVAPGINLEVANSKT